MSIRHRLPLGLASLALCSVGFAQQAIKLDIEAQPLDRALNTWATQTGYQVLIPTDRAARGRAAPAVKGRYTPEGALKVLLASSDLKYEFVNNRTVTIRPAASDQSKAASENSRAETASPLVLAQSRPREREAAASRESQGQGGSREPIEEILVTAQKRSERLQDVPISISALSTEDIERRRYVNSEDYLRGIPGASQVEGYTGQSITIRGLETTPYFQNFFTGTTTATYFGETPTTNTAGLGGGTNIDIKLVDVERVEVLRGPQGTAFGSSSMGGTVRVIPAAPEMDHFFGKVTAGFSETARYGGGNHTAQGVVNIPLARDKFAIRAAAYEFNDSGYYRNDSLSSTNPAFQTLVTQQSAQSLLIDKDDIGAYQVIGGRIAAAYQATDSLKFTLSYLSQQNQRDGSPVANSGAYQQEGFELAPRHVIRGQTLGRTDMDIDIANAVVEYDFSRASLLATYSHTKSGAGISFAHTIASGDNFPWSQNASSDHSENVGEVRLTTQLEGAWNFLVGAYVEDLHDSGVFDNYWVGPIATSPFGPNAAFGTRDDRRTLKQKAGFGEVSWKFLDRFTLTAGVRAYDFDRTFDVDTIGQAYNGAALRDSHVITNRKTGASGESYRANLSYKPTEDANLYAGFSQGFRLGNSQIGLPAGSCDLNGDGVVDGTGITIESTQRVNSDDVDNYEIGAKFTTLGRRLSISADVFRMKWYGLPFNINPLSTAPGCQLTYLSNVTKAVSDGVEFQLAYQVTDPLRVDLSGSWIHARLDADKPAPQPAPKGNQLPGSPKYNASVGLQYEFAVAGRKPFVRIDSVYVGSFYGEIQELPNSRVEDYVKVDLSAGMNVRDIALSLYVNNLTNEDAFTFRNIAAGPATVERVVPFYGYRLRPRTVGFQASYAF